MGANDELRLPDTATRQSAANAVLKSASKSWDDVGEKRVVVGDDEEGRDGHDSLETVRVKRTRRLEPGPTQILLCTPVYSCVRAASRTTMGKI